MFRNNSWFDAQHVWTPTLTSINRAPKSHLLIVVVVIPEHESVSSIDNHHLGSVTGGASYEGLNAITVTSGHRKVQKTPSSGLDKMLNCWRNDHLTHDMNKLGARIFHVDALAFGGMGAQYVLTSDFPAEWQSW